MANQGEKGAGYMGERKFLPAITFPGKSFPEAATTD
jgi:hypothetical protein